MTMLGGWNHQYRSGIGRTIRRLRTSRILFAVVAALALSLWATTSGRAQSVEPDDSLRLPVVLAQSEAASAEAGAAFVPGEILVGLRGDALGAAAVLEQFDAETISTFGAADAGVAGYVLRVELGAELATAAALAQHPAVAYAEPNWIVRAADAEVDAAADAATDAVAAEIPVRVNDPLYRTWQWHLPRIHASRGWALSGAVFVQEDAAAAIRVAVIDSGVDTNHPDLAKNVDIYAGKSYVEDSPTLDDSCGHGTHVIGLIAATTNNGRGVAGTALNATTVPLKTLRWHEYAPDQWGCVGDTLDVTQAVYDAAGAGYDIINLSLELASPSPTLEAAVNYAQSRGALLIAAAGNCQPGEICPSPVRYPAAYPAVMAIAATGYYDTRAYYSAVGPEIDLAAPGGDGVHWLVSTWSDWAAPRCAGNRSDGGGGLYCEASGTSMAAGVATGAAALVWSARPDLTAAQVRYILEESARPIPGSAAEVGRGLLDVERALRYAQRSRLVVSPAALSYRSLAGSAPFTQELVLTNPSLEPIGWSITRTQQIEWLSPGEPSSGTVRYGQPVRAGLTISPTHLASGTYASSLWVEGERLDGSHVLIPVDARLAVYAPAAGNDVYLPSIANAAQQGSSWPVVDFAWEWPDVGGRSVHFLTDNSSIAITLPLTITTGGAAYVDARLYSDGYVALPEAARIARPGAECLPLPIASGPVVFGWWADLNPGMAGARVSSFRAGPDRFVVEYLDVPSATGQPAYTVSFQIVLYADGRIGLNYLHVPDGAPPRVTAGIQTQDGRYFNQLACVTSSTEIGSVPRAYQSMLFAEGDLF